MGLQFSRLKSLLAVCSLYALLAFSLARRFPPVNSDEVVRAVMGSQWIRHEPPRYSLYDDVFARPVYELRDVLPEISLTLYHAWLGAWSAIRPSGYMSSRLSSIAAGTLALLVFYGLGARLGGPGMNLWCILLAVCNPLFLTASCLARPETLLLLTFTSVLWLTLVIPERVGLKPFLIGSLGMLQMSIHPNASVMCTGLFVFYLLSVPRHARFSKGSLFAAGATAGLLASFLLVDARRLWLGFHTLHAYLLRPPVLLWPWHPLDWLLQTVEVMWTGQTFYFDSALAAGWPLCLQFWFLAMGILGMMAGMQKWKKREGLEFFRWPAALLATFIATFVMVKAKECLYVTNFFPFLIPIAASGLAHRGNPSWRKGKVLACALVVLGLFLFLDFSQNYAARTKPYAQIVQELRAMLPQGRLKVAGPCVLWFAWDKDLFRDSGAIILSHWYTGGRRDIQSWLRPWHPDILILDHAMQNIVRKPGAAHLDLASFFDCPINFLGEVDTQGAYGRWAVYFIHWGAVTRKA